MNNLDFISMASGGQNARYSVNRKDVRVEQKASMATEEPAVRGVAKASPKFEVIEPEKEQTEEEQKRSIARATLKVSDETQSEQESVED